MDCFSSANRLSGERSYVGIAAENCIDSMRNKGAYVVGFFGKSPAAAHGLKLGDRVIQFGGCPVKNRAQLTEAIANHTVRASVDIYFVRDSSVNAERITVMTSSASISSSERAQTPRTTPDQQALCQAAGLQPWFER